jgi:protein involved in plasmid replication-relaxation
MKDKGLPAATVEIVGSVAQHRALTTAQLQTIHLPGRSRRWAQNILSRLARAGLLSHVRIPQSPGRRLWFVTEDGARLAQDAGVVREPPKVLTAAQAAGQLHAHTLAVTDAAIAFLCAARDRGDDFGPFSWHHEVSHPLAVGRGRRSPRAVADAVLTYVLTGREAEDISVAQRFLELDRATLSVNSLAAELARYADLHGAEGRHGEPIWRERYPIFPAVLCILAGSSRPALERRRLTAMALLRNDPRLSSAPPDVAVSIGLLEDLQERGPFAGIFDELHHPGERVDWLGHVPRGDQ